MHNIYNPEDEIHKKRIIRFINRFNEKSSIGLRIWDDSPQIVIDTINTVINRNISVSLLSYKGHGPNLREFMHLMGLPHDFQLATTTDTTPIVPVSTATDMTAEVLKFLNGELPLSTEKFLKQNNISKTVEKIGSPVESISLF